MRTIVCGNERMTLNDDGTVARLSLPAPRGTASGQWKVTGAVTLSNFGTVTRRWSLADILADPPRSRGSTATGSRRHTLPTWTTRPPGRG
jgi:hypothetical protein